MIDWILLGFGVLIAAIGWRMSLIPGAARAIIFSGFLAIAVGSATVGICLGSILTKS